MQIKRFFILSIVVFHIFSCTGCWDKKEINQIGFAVGLGIDKDKDGYQVTTQMALPALLEGGGSGDEPPVWVVGGKGKTIFEAIRDINTRSARKPFWGHLNVIILGEEVTQDGIVPVLDMLSRGHELRRLNYIIAAKGKARDILEAVPKLESINAIFIRDLVTNRTGQSVAPGITLNDLLIALDSAGREAVLPKIEAFEQESYLPSKPQVENEEGEKKPKQILELKGMGIFKEDQLVKWLDEKSTRGYLWIVNEIGSGIVVLENPEQSKADISLEIKNAKSKINVILDDNAVDCTIQIKANFNLVENMGFIGLEKQSYINKVNQKASEVIKEEIFSTVLMSQEAKSDIFGIGELIRKKYPEYWQNIKWSEVYPEIKINIEVDANVEQATMTLRPVSLPRLRKK